MFDFYALNQTYHNTQLKLTSDALSEPRYVLVSLFETVSFWFSCLF